MNKTLLFLSALAICGSSVYAQANEPILMKAAAASATVQAKADEQDGTMEFRYYQDGAVDGLSFQGLYSGEVWQAVCMPQESAVTYAGNSITAINVMTPPNVTQGSNVNMVRMVTVFLSTGLDEEPIFKKEVDFGVKTDVKQRIELDTPYEISGENDICFGYYFTLNRNIAINMGYIATDAVPTTNENASLVAINGEWQTCRNFGSLLIGAEIKGDNLPVNLAAVGGVSGQIGYATKGKEFGFTVDVLNAGANEISNVEIEYAFGEGETATVKHSFDTPLGLNERGSVELSVVCDQAGKQIPLTATVTKVNGVENKFAGNSASLAVDSYVNPYRRNVLVEEGTGTWCPNCPPGLIAMDVLKEKYTDGSVVLVGAHANDKMAVSSYTPFLTWAITGYPQFVVNRKDRDGFSTSTDYNVSNMESYISKYFAAPAQARVDLYLEWTDDSRSSIHAAAQSVFAEDLSGTYKIAFIVVEDGVGPYTQSNNFTGVSGLGAFSTGGSYVSWTYNDVARNIFDAFGMDESAISKPEAGTYYTYEYDIPLTNVTNIQNARIIAALLNNANREVVNVIEVPLINATGVCETVAETSNVSVRAEMGCVVVNGADTTEVYTIDGRRAATAYGEASISLPAGLYIVKADKLVKKVIVK